MEMSRALEVFEEVELERSKGASVLEACTKAKCSATTYYKARKMTESYRSEARETGNFSNGWIDDRIKELTSENDLLRAENQRLKNRLVRDAIEKGSVRDMVIEYLLNQE